MTRFNDISKFNLFMKSPEVYNLNKGYWNNLIKDLSPDFREWMNTKFENGEDANDGNPLVALRNGDIAIRIIQIERNSLQPKFASWEKKYQDINVKELVICIQPYNTTYNETEYLIKKFLHGRHRRFLERNNIKYNNLLNSNRTNFLINRLENISFRIIEKENVLIANRLSIKNIKEITKKLEVNDSTFKNKRIERKYNQSISKALKINLQLSKKRKMNSQKVKSLDNAFKNLKISVISLKKEIENQEKNISL